MRRTTGTKATDTVTIQIEVTPERYAQIERIALMWGVSVQEWVDEVIANNV